NLKSSPKHDLKVPSSEGIQGWVMLGINGSWLHSFTVSGNYDVWCKGVRVVWFYGGMVSGYQ
ncbi:MAG TPA: hypothetical protein PK643_16410, partial [Saprospiraceae bacterium]|nr:hypothetical protein [Saprospiraceae bacterium]